MAAQQQCVLVVDDDDSIRRMIATALERRGYSLCEARNGKEALEEMRLGSTDLVVLDLMMPEISGWDVLAERDRDPRLRRIPVIVITANRSPQLAHAVSSNICALLPKPFDLDALYALVEACLEQNAA
ncbi:MAG TPA: response regulator [Thermoanaerobaculia bacterium]|nr:response regulator [Thermoanaerobaculia bacterium]